MKTAGFTGLLIASLLIVSCNINPPDNTELNEYAPCCLNDPFNDVVGEGRMYIPNMITANFDGVNDVFYPLVSSGISKIEEFEIRSPGGQVLYSKATLKLNDPSDGWSAAISPTEVYRGLFLYSMKVVDQAGYGEIIQGAACSFACDAPANKIGNIGNCYFPSQHDGMGGLDTLLSSGETDCF